jgi:flagellar biogenesis protein FliO
LFPILPILPRSDLANPVATAQKVLAVRLGGMILSIALLVAASFMFRRQERSAQMNRQVL